MKESGQLRNLHVEVYTSPCLAAQIMFGFGPGSNDSNQTLYRTFRAFSDHSFFAKKKLQVFLVICVFGNCDFILMPLPNLDGTALALIRPIERGGEEGERSVVRVADEKCKGRRDFLFRFMRFHPLWLSFWTQLSHKSGNTRICSCARLTRDTVRLRKQIPPTLFSRGFS
jgi:hypothetical protein